MTVGLGGASWSLPRPKAIELRRVRLPLVAPIEAAHGVEDERAVVIVRVFGDDGGEGWGECEALARPTYTAEWHDAAWLVLRDLLAPAVLAGDDARLRGQPMAVAAIETALVDLAARASGRSLAEVVGAAVDRVVSRAVLGIGSDVDAVVGVVGERVAAGHRAVKLKIRPGWDVAPLAAVRAAWPDLDLAADANGSYDLDAATGLAVAVEPLDLAYVEQPLAAPDLVGHAALRRRTGLTVALDESAVDRGSVDAAHELGAVDLVNVKLARLGGVGPSLALRDLLVERGIGGFCGGMYELGIGRAAALALAAVPGLDGPADLGPSGSYVDPDLTEPVELEPDGTLAVPSGPGIGSVPDLDRLDAATVERCTIERR